MKKVKYILIFGFVFPFISLVLLLLVIGGLVDQAAPLDPPATEEQVYNYMYVGSELGVPWDIVLLSDAILADQLGLDSIEDYNAILTSLEFCSVKENVYVWVEKEYTIEDMDDESKDGEGHLKDEGQVKKTEVRGEWEYSSTNYYIGKNQILRYLNRREDEMNYTMAATMATEVNAAATKKSGSQYKYEAGIEVNTNYESILRDYIKLDEMNIKNVIELYDSKYLVYLYGYESGLRDINIELPEVTLGNLTRQELIGIAASLVDFPYLFGGKSYSKGLPASAMDCSGFVDWVFVQCFGKGVSGGLGGTEVQFYSCAKILQDDLMVGDLGFYYDPARMTKGQINHVGIYVGKINGIDAFIHCGGKSFGYDKRPNGRVGISINQSGVMNSYNNITGETFSPAMPGTRFKYFRRPQFVYN